MNSGRSTRSIAHTYFIENQRERIASQRNLNSKHCQDDRPLTITTPIMILNLSDSSFNQTAGESLNTGVFVVIGAHIEECAHIVHLIGGNFHETL